MSKHYAIKCTNCAAPLDVLGGGRVSTITCSYCHTMLDMNDKYKVLSKFNDVKRPDAPFEIGMRGYIKDVEWIIIGYVTYKTIDFPSETWHEYFLYSATHGYAWLVYENGTTSFSTRVRDYDLLKWQKSKPMTTFYKKGHYIRKEELYHYYVEYVEGELSSIVKFGDRFTCWDYSGVRRQTLSVEKYVTELEVYHAQELNKEALYKNFSLPYDENYDKKPESSNNEDFNAVPEYILQGTKWIAIFFTLLIISSLFMDKTLFSSVYDVNRNNNSENIIDITSDIFLGEIEIEAKRASDLQNFSLKLTRENSAKPYFYLSKKNIYSKHKKHKNTWNNNTTKMTMYIKLTKGRYILFLKNTKNVEVTLRQSVMRLFYIFPMLLIWLGFLYYLHQTGLTLTKILLYLMLSPLLFYFPVQFIIIGLIIYFFYFKEDYHG